MSDTVTRRDFVANAALAGLASTVGLSGTASLAQGAKPMASARRVSFDSGWMFSRGDFPQEAAPIFDDRSWQSVDLPHDWSITGPYSKDEPCGGSGGYLPTGLGWYRKSFALPAAADQHVFIHVDGVYQRSEVWINGQPLGLRPNGYISFVYDLTPHLRPAGQRNVISVRVDNSLQPNSRWYSGSGITRHVWLITTPPIHIAHWGVAIGTSDVSTTGATVTVTTRVINSTVRGCSCRVETTLLAPDGGRIGNAADRVPIDGGAEQALTQRIALANPVLWDLANPRLYAVVSVAQADGLAPDQVTTPFGIRNATFDVDRGFLLNGVRVKLNGVCLHNDCGAVGAAVPERMWERRLTLLKDMGCNAIRTTHNPAPPEFLDLCDSMGFLVMAEAFDEWRQPKLQTPQYGYHRYFDEWAARDLADMIDRDRNHPSIVIWSAGNEVPDQTDPRGPQTLQSLLDVLHAKDPARPVTVGCDNIAAEPKEALPEFLAKLDVVGYNYVDRWRERREQFYSVDRHAFPQRRVVGTESESMGGVRGAYAPINDPPVFGERTSNRRIAVEQLQKFVHTYDYVRGDFMWTGIDYLGESFWPYKLAPSGVLDTCGFPKDGYYFYQSVWTTRSVLHLFPHWNWPGKEGQLTTVTCYTNCDEVELFQDGKSRGVRGYAFPRPGMISKWGTYPPRAKALQTTADLHLSWDVPYAPGSLKAVGRRNGEIVTTAEVRTTGDPVAIRLSADRSRINTTRRDLAHVTAEVTDAAGDVVPTSNDLLTFSMQGNGRIIGLDNGQPDSHESYQGRERRTFNGLALALIQSTGKPGKLVLRASAPGLTGAQLEIEAR